MKISSSPKFRSQASAALEQLEAEGHLETPSDRVRKSLARLLSRSEETMRSGL